MTNKDTLIRHSSYFNIKKRHDLTKKNVYHRYLCYDYSLPKRLCVDTNETR